jgi:integrase
MPHVKLFVILALSTGGRTGAILELEWNRVSFEEGTIDLRIDTPANPLLKTARKGRAKVPMNNLARAALQEASQGSLTDWVIEWDGEPIKSVRKGFMEACRRAELEDVTPHTLRHTAASWMESGRHSDGADQPVPWSQDGKRDPQHLRKTRHEALTAGGENSRYKSRQTGAHFEETG